MTRFGADPQAFFAAVYTGDAPWDTGAPQPAMTALLAEFPPRGPALDLGCGSGDLAIHLARNGIDTLGVDFVEAAVELARANAATHADLVGALEFRVADAFRPSLLRRTFETVVDSGFFHLFSPEEGDQLVREIHAILSPGGRLYLHEFATEFPIPNSPRQVTEAEVRARFTPERGWRVLAVHSGDFLNRVAPVPGTVACIERLTTRARG